MFAPLVSVAIDRVRLFENTRLQLSRTEAIGEINRAIYDQSDFDRIVDKICITLIEKFDVKKTHLYKLDGDNKFVPVVAWENTDGVVVPSNQATGPTVEKSIARWCIDNQKTGFVKRHVNDKRESEEVHQLREMWRLGSTICLPLVHENKSWGVLYAHRSTDSQDFTDGEVKLFELMGSQLSVALLRRELMLKVEHQAYHDSLTGLANRNRFESILAGCIEAADASDDTYAVKYVDLNGFKEINDNFGHHRGDKLLKEVAARISMQVNREDHMARMGGDEFALVLKRSCRDQVVQAARRINASLAGSIEIDGLRAKIGVSVGIVFFPEDGNTTSDILKNADFAMYHAKQSGKLAYSVFKQSYRLEFEQRIQWEADLRSAISAGEFELYYQPKIDCNHGGVCGVEALIRWAHPQHGFIPPSKFIPLAERTGNIEAIGEWVLQTACRQSAELYEHGFNVSVAINISGQQLLIENFAAQVLEAIEQYKVPQHLLEVEVTETVFLKDINGVIETLSKLRSKGIKVSIDDFGTGYSALHYLAKLPLDTLKIDKTFIDDICISSKGKSLVEIILQIAKALGLATVAEGVESADQVEMLEQLGCDAIQGYYYSRPLPFHELKEFLAAGRNPANQARAA
jgi:diguanylate cyclase (GGDEF)-like protein